MLCWEEPWVIVGFSSTSAIDMESVSIWHHCVWVSSHTWLFLSEVQVISQVSLSQIVAIMDWWEFCRARVQYHWIAMAYPNENYTHGCWKKVYALTLSIIKNYPSVLIWYWPKYHKYHILFLMTHLDPSYLIFKHTLVSFLTKKIPDLLNSFIKIFCISEDIVLTFPN